MLLNDTRSFSVATTGLAPDTDYEIWMYSTPTKLGNYTTSANGSHTTTITVPDDIDGG